jgi:hypothetical protein
VEDDRYVFVFVMHHIITDGWSVAIQLDEILRLYEWYDQEQPAGVLPLRLQYRDYAAWQQQQLSGKNLLLHQQYWLDKFRGEIPVLTLPTDFPRFAIKTYNGCVHSFLVNEVTTYHLNDLKEKQGVSLFSLLLTSVYVLLYRWGSTSTYCPCGCNSTRKVPSPTCSRRLKITPSLPTNTKFTPSTCW